MADPADPVDLLLAAGLQILDRGISSKLLIRRLGCGKYEIDDRKVTVRWTEQGHPAGLVVSEDNVADFEANMMPLQAYLSQAANVAASLSGQRADMPKIARIPKEQRLTFVDASATDTAAAIETMGNERCESMRIACEQARLREQAAEAYEHGLYGSFPKRSLPPPPGLPVPFLN